MRPNQALRKRMRVRVPARVKVDEGAAFDAQMVHLTEERAYLLADRSGNSAELGGSTVELTFTLGELGELRTAAVIDWVDPEARDLRDRDALGMELSLELSESQRDAISESVDERRVAVLLIDDDVDNVDLLVRVLKQERAYDLHTAYDGVNALAIIDEYEIGVIVTDFKMPGMSGLELLKRVAKKYPTTPMNRILVTAYGSMDTIGEFINDGEIVHYLNKPLQSAEMRRVVKLAADGYLRDVERDRLRIELARANAFLRRENLYLRERAEGVDGFEEIVGHSEALREALSEIERVRETDVSVHVTGETGTGKELVARALHDGSPRAGKPFVVQNCAGIPESLVESTLFGHVRGSFTGADRDAPGVFREADGGTLVLDEVSELPARVQAALLRALQDGEVMPVGASRPVSVDVRIISCTHDDLRHEVEAGRFREDLYYRLVVVSIELPPLRKRTGDIQLLAQHFLDVSCSRYGRDIPGISEEAMTAMLRYSWPGNIRELNNEVERWVVLAPEGQPVPLEVLSPALRAPPREEPKHYEISTSLTYDAALDELGREILRAAMTAEDGVVARAAKRLGLTRARMVKLLERLRIE